MHLLYFCIFYSKGLSVDATETHFSCEVGVVIDCPEKEICVPRVTHSRNGICQCVEDYQRNSSGMCTPIG